MAPYGCQAMEPFRDHLLEPVQQVATGFQTCKTPQHSSQIYKRDRPEEHLVAVEVGAREALSSVPRWNWS